MNFGFLSGGSSGGGAISGLTYLGTWDASLNFPLITSGVGTSGDYYIVSVAGNTIIDGVSDWGVGDWIIFSSTGVWQKIDNSDLEGYNLIQNESVTLVKRSIIDFQGAGVVAVDDPLNSKTIVTIDGQQFGKFGIADSNGLYTYYNTLTLALASATDGQCVEFFTDYVETGAVTINLLDGVNVNMNGHSYTATNNLSSFPLFSANNVKCQFNNGTILIDTDAPAIATITAFLLNNTSDVDCNGIFVRVIGSSSIGIGANLTTTGCTLRNLTVETVISTGITAISGASLYFCSSKSQDGNGISLGNTLGTSGTNFAYNCIGISQNNFGIFVGFNSRAMECLARSTSQPAFRVVAGTILGGSAFAGSNFAVSATTNGGLTAQNFRIFGVNVEGFGGIIATYAGGELGAVGRGSIENCSITSTGNGIEVVNTFPDRITIVQNTIRLSSSANDCIFASVPNSRASYANNIFQNSVSPINTNVIQDVINTFDNQGNILI